MYPVLFSVGPITVYTFGLFLVVAVIAGMFTIWKYGRKAALPDEKLLDAVVLVFFAGFFSARIFYILFHFSAFGLEVGKWILFLRYPGFSFIGAFLGGLVVLSLFAFLEKQNFPLLADIFSLGLLSGKFWGDIGCFLNGCEVGGKTTSPIGFPVTGYLGQRHPVSLYDAFLSVVFFLVLLRLYYRLLRDGSQRKGLIFLLFLFFYGLSSFVLEVFRENTLYLFGYRLGFLGGGFLVVFSVVILYFRTGRSAVKDLRAIATRLEAGLYEVSAKLRFASGLVRRKVKILTSGSRRKDDSNKEGGFTNSEHKEVS